MSNGVTSDAIQNADRNKVNINVLNSYLYLFLQDPGWDDEYTKIL